MTPLQIKHQIDRAFELAKINGFELDLYDQIGIVANHAPYTSGVTIKILPSFEAVVWFLQGYQQHKFEGHQIDGAKDAV
jgi:hypothetical protein